MNNFKNLTLAIVASLGMVGVANADALSYDYVGAGVSYLNLDSGSADSFGAFVNGSKSINDNLFVFGSYSYDHNDNVDIGINQVRAGVGGRFSVSNSTDLYGTVYGFYGSSIYDFDVRLADTWGYGVETGVRSRFSDFELKVGVSHEQYTDFDFSDNYVVVGAAYHFTDSVAGTVDVRHTLDGSYHTTAGVRFSF